MLINKNISEGSVRFQLSDDIPYPGSTATALFKRALIRYTCTHTRTAPRLAAVHASASEDRVRLGVAQEASTPLGFLLPSVSYLTALF